MEASRGGKGIPSRSVSLFFKPSRNLVTRREESQASAVNKTVHPVPLTAEEAATVAATRAAVVGAITLLIAGFG
jgi:hypothetical protein